MPKYKVLSVPSAYVNSSGNVLYSISFDWGGHKRIGSYSFMYHEIGFTYTGVSFGKLVKRHTEVTNYPKYLKSDIAWRIYEAMSADTILYYEYDRQSNRRTQNLRYFNHHTLIAQHLGVIRLLQFQNGYEVMTYSQSDYQRMYDLMVQHLTPEVTFLFNDDMSMEKLEGKQCTIELHHEHWFKCTFGADKLDWVNPYNLVRIPKQIAAAPCSNCGGIVDVNDLCAACYVATVGS